MSRARAPFGRRLGLWVPPAIVLAAGLFFLARHLAAGGEPSGAVDRRIASAMAERDQARAEEARLAELVRDEAANRRDVDVLYRERFSTEQGRFTDLVREIKRLAEHSGLDPREIGYPEESFGGYELTRRSFVFGVEGGYPNLRTFLHLLELSPSFVTVNEIRVSERKGSGLTVRLQLSTFFFDPEADARRKAASS
jgi:hypothetical protein